MIKGIRDKFFSLFSPKNLLFWGLVTLLVCGFWDLAAADDVPCRPTTYRENLRTCWFCKLFEIVFNASSTIALKSYQALAQPVAYVVAVFTGIWVVMTIISFVSSVESKDAKGLIKALLNQAFLVMIIMFFLLNDTADFFALALEPIFNTGFKLAQIVVNPTAGNCTTGSGIITDGGLPPSMGTSIVCTIQVLQNSLQDVMSIGYSAMCVGFRQKAIIEFLIPHFGYFFSGLLIWIGALILLIGFPFLLIDAVLQLAVASALLPAAIGAYAFKATRKYTGNIWKTFMTAMFIFIFLSIIIAILSEAIRQTLSDSIDKATSDQVLNQGKIELILSELSWTGVAWLKVIFILILAWAVLKEANAFGKQYGGGGFTSDLGSNIGGTLLSGAKNTATKAGKAVWNEGKRFVGAVKDTVKGKAHVRNMERTASRLNNRFKNAKDNGDGTKTYTNRWGRKFTLKQNSSGGVTSKHKTLFGRTVERGYNVAEDGSITTDKNKAHKGFITGKLKETRTHSDSVLTLKSHYVDGKYQYTDAPKINSAVAKNMINKDGSYNTDAISQLQDSMKNMDKGQQAAVIKTIIAQSIPHSDIDHFSRSDNVDVKRGTDDKGRSYTEVVEQRGGKTYRYRLTEGSGGRMLSEINVESTNKKGNTRIKRLATDGIFNHKSDVIVDADGNVISSVSPSETTFSDYYKAHKTVDAYGNMSSYIPQGEIMMDQELVNDAVYHAKNVRLEREEDFTLKEFSK